MEIESDTPFIDNYITYALFKCGNGITTSNKDKVLDIWNSSYEQYNFYAIHKELEEYTEIIEDGGDGWCCIDDFTYILHTELFEYLKNGNIYDKDEGNYDNEELLRRVNIIANHNMHKIIKIS